MAEQGQFCISLDFELMWGVKDSRTLQEYGPNILGAREAIPAMLSLFHEFEVHASWATVGLLFCQTKQELMDALPEIRPAYRKPGLSAYDHLDSIGDNERDDPYHYGYSLLQQIEQTPHQEIASHSFSHYYCCEEGATAESFEADILACRNMAEKRGLTLESFVFPRNQSSAEAIELLSKYGFRAIRGNEHHWAYDTGSTTGESKPKRAFRLADSYLNFSGHHTHEVRPLGTSQTTYNVPASRFLRPYHARLAPLDALKIRRITRAMTHAARQKQLFHLWWHPHNFGREQAQNLQMLRRILEHYRHLQHRYGMTSVTMRESVLPTAAATTLHHAA